MPITFRWAKDQLQHLEMTRDVASRFNHKMGETFVVPKEMIRQETQLIPWRGRGQNVQVKRKHHQCF
jgi:tryptophanyl-tRNA synthetase